MKITEYWDKFTSRERRLLLVGIGVVVIAGMYSLWDSQTAVAPVPPIRAGVGGTVSQPAMPQGYAPAPGGNGELRDPFAIPPGYQDREPSAGSTALTSPVAKGEKHFSASSPIAANRAAASYEPVKQQAALPVLTGVGGTENRRVALIQYGGKTQPYEVNDMIGSGYQLLAVYDNSATVWGPNGKLVLTLGR